MTKIVGGLAAIAVLMIAVPSLPAWAVEKAVIGYSSADATSAPVYYAQDKGLFRKYGLATTIVFLDSGAKGVQGLIGGAVDLLKGDGDSIVNARLSGVEIRSIGVSVGVMSGDVVAAKDIKTAQDLKGKKWGISSFGSEAQLAEQLFLRANNLAETDVTVIQLGNQGNRYAALDAGQIAVSSFLPPVMNKLESAGYPALAHLPDLAPHYLSTGPATMLATIQKRPALVKGFLQAMAEAHAMMKKDRAGSVAIIKQYFKATDEEADAAWAYYAPLYPVPPRAPPEAVQFILDQSKDLKAKTLKPSDIIDNTIMDQLEAEGFFKTLN